MPDAPPKFTLPRILICEGNEDKAFFERLIEVRGLPGFHIRTTANTRTEAGGNTRFVTALHTLRVLRNFEVIQHILLVTDADDDSDQRFRWLCDQIVASGFEPSPPECLEKSTAKPAVTVMVIPVGEKTGCLEFLCGGPARRADSKTGALVDNFVDLASSGKWQPRHRAKVWLRTNLAARASDPFVFLGSVLHDQKNNHLIPLEDSSFQPIVDVLSTFGPSLTPARARRPPVTKKRAQTRPEPRMRQPGGSLYDRCGWWSSSERSRCIGFGHIFRRPQPIDRIGPSKPAKVLIINAREQLRGRAKATPLNHR